MTPLLQLLAYAPVGIILVMMLTGVVWFKPAADHQRSVLDEQLRKIGDANAAMAEELASLGHISQKQLLEVQAWEQMDTIGGRPMKARASSRKEGDYGFVPATAVDENEVVEEIHELGKKDPVAVVLKDGTVVDQAELASRSAERTQRAITGKPRSFRDLPEDVIQTNLGYSDPGERPRRPVEAPRPGVRTMDLLESKPSYRPGRTMADAKKVAAAAARQSDRDYCLEQLLGRGTERSLAEWTVDESGLDVAVMAANFRNPPEPERAPR